MARGTSSVKFGATKCTKRITWSHRKIKCRVPAKAKSGKASITVTIAVGASNVTSFTLKRPGAA